jgi:hypothetical protein
MLESSMKGLTPPDATATCRPRSAGQVRASQHAQGASDGATDREAARRLTSKGASYQRLLDKAVDEKIEQEAARLEQLAAAEKSNSGKKADHLLGDSAGDGGEDTAMGEQTRRRSSRATKKPEREGQIWLGASNNGLESATEPKEPPSVDLFLEIVETLVVKTEDECFDLIDRIGSNLDIDTPLFLLQAEHWHERAEDNYASIKEAMQRHAGEGEAVCWRLTSTK